MKQLLFATLLLFSADLKAQSYVDSLEQAREDHKTELLDTSAGVLNLEDLIHFKGANYFPISEVFKVKGTFIKDLGKKFKMPTTTERTPVYRRYGYVRFEMNQITYQLTVYQNMELIEREGYEDYLFIPFLDETNGLESYGGGRYLDFRIPKNEKVELDFNTAYNPYCAYSHRYSCPIPPSENTLKVSIKAGEKTPTYRD